MSDAVQRILAALREHGYAPRKAGAEWECRCPAHDDRRPSLSIRRGDDGRALVNCHAGCTVDAVCAAVGLTLADLFADSPGKRNGHAPKRPTGVNVYRIGPCTSAKGISVDVDAPSKPDRVFPTARDAVAALEAKHGPRSALWTYHDKAGEPVGVVVRWDVPRDPSDPKSKPSKRILPVSLTPGGWACAGMPTPRPLYGLPALLATTPGERVYVCEGEKAADAARAVGLLATTSPHGSKSASKADWSPAAGLDVVIFPDHDEAGERYAADVSRLATAAGAKSVRVARLVELWAEMPKGGDMADLFEHRGGDVDPIRADVEALANTIESEAVARPTTIIAPFEPFPVEVLPEPIRGLVIDVSKAVGCDTSYVALPLLAGLASAIGNSSVVELKRGWTEPPILWTAIVGESGTAKSPALDLALRPIRKRQHDAMKEHNAAMDLHAEATARYERDFTKWKQRKSTEAPPLKPQAPTLVRCWTDDATTEALAMLLQQNPRGLLMARDELAGWFAFDAYKASKGGDAAKWLEMYGGRAMVVDRKGGGTLYVPRAAVSLTGGIQPETLRRVVGIEHTENGLASRLLMAYPPKLCPGWTDDDVDPAIEAALAEVFERLYLLTPDSDANGDDRPKCLPLHRGARSAMVRWVNEHAARMEELSGPVGYAWAKLKGGAARLALVIHATRWAAHDPTLRDSACVDEASIAAGVTLARWFGNEAHRLYAVLFGSDDDRKALALIDLIRRHGGSINGRELVQASRDYDTVADAEAALSALASREVGSWLRPQQRGRGRPKAPRFVLAPAYCVHVYRNPASGAENGQSVDVDCVGTDPATGHTRERA